LLGGSIQIGTELSEGSDFSVLGKFKLESTSDSLHGLDLSSRSDSGDGKTDVNGRSDTLVEEFSFQENLSISNGNNVGGDISRHITSLGLNDGKSSEGTSTEGFVHLGSSFEESGMEVEDVTRVGFSTGRSSQQEGHLSVSDGLLGKIVVDDEAMSATVSEELTDGTSGVRSQVLEGSSFGSGSGNDDSVLHGTVVSENLDQVSDGRSLLSDSNVDAEKLLLGVTSFEVLLLVQDSIDSDGSLTSLSITNDEFSLTSSNGDQTIDSLKTSLHRFVDGLSGDNTRSLNFDSLSSFSLTGPKPSMGLPRASKTLPNISSPMGTSTIAPVLLTTSPS